MSPKDADTEVLRLQDTFRASWKAAVVAAFTITGDKDAAEDVVQEAFLRVWNKRSHWRDGKPLDGLLFKTARNLAWNAVRDVRRRGELLDRNARFDYGCSGRPGHRRAVVDLERFLVESIRKLPVRRRRVFALRACIGMSTAEVAERLNIGEQPVANMLAAARKMLRRELVDAGWL